MVVDLALAVLVLADADFGLFGSLLGVFVATGWRGESSAEAVADAAAEIAPPRARFDRRVAAVLLMVAFFGYQTTAATVVWYPKKAWRNEKDCLDCLAVKQDFGLRITSK